MRTIPSPTITQLLLWANGDYDLSGCSATYSDISDGDAGKGNISDVHPHSVGRNKDGSIRVFLHLVRGYRVNAKVRQKVGASLARLVSESLGA